MIRITKFVLRLRSIRGLTDFLLHFIFCISTMRKFCRAVALRSCNSRIAERKLRLPSEESIKLNIVEKWGGITIALRKSNFILIIHLCSYTNLIKFNSNNTSLQLLRIENSNSTSLMYTTISYNCTPYAI